MALSRTNHTNGETSSGSGAVSHTSAAFTPADNSLLVAAFVVFNGGAITAITPTISGGGWTWTQQLAPAVTTYAGGNYSARMFVYTAPVTTGASMTVTCGATESIGDFQFRIILHVLGYTGYHVASPIGATITNTTPGDAGLTITLSGAPAADSEVVAVRARSDLDAGIATGATPDAAWTEIYDDFPSAAHSLQTMIRTGSTSTSVIWTDTSDNASANSFMRHTGALEIKAAAAAGTLMGAMVM